MPYFDILILALIAIFVALRLRSNLGKNVGFDPRTDRKADNAPTRAIPLPDLVKPAPTKPKPDFADSLSTLPPRVAEGLERIRTADAEFATEEFIQGARMAYEMVIAAFSEHALARVKMLLLDEVYASFDAAIKAREAEGERVETTLIAITASDIIEAELNGSVAVITVRFDSKQITVLRDRDGKLKEGDPSAEEDVQNEWTFERDTRSRNPNWTITAT